MTQSRRPHPTARFAVLWAALASLTPAGCDRPPAADPSHTTQPAQTSATSPVSSRATTSAAAPVAGVVTVASLVPAATSLLLGMGAADRLVAVSNYESPDDRTRALPRVGDYQTVDWEQLAALRPGVIVVAFAADRVPPGLTQRAAALGAAVVNVNVNGLDDVYRALGQLGDATRLRPEADAAAARLRARLDAVRARVAGRPRVRTLIIFDDDGQSAVGSNEFLGDLLAIAGGDNVLAGDARPYPQIDRERLLSLRPDAILQLRPGATPQEVDRANRSMAQLTSLPAVRDRRVHVVTDPWVLLPGYRIGELAERFATLLHGDDAPTTRPSAARGADGYTPTARRHDAADEPAGRQVYGGERATAPTVAWASPPCVPAGQTMEGGIGPSNRAQLILSVPRLATDMGETPMPRPMLSHPSVPPRRYFHGGLDIPAGFFASPFAPSRLRGKSAQTPRRGR